MALPDLSAMELDPPAFSTDATPFREQERSEEPLDILPDEILLLIFSFVGPKEAASTLTLVSKRFKTLAGDQSLWRVFCDSLGIPQKLLERESLDYKAAYPQMIKLSQHMLHNQFVIESWRDSARVPCASSHDLCCFQEGDTLYFCNIWSKKTEFSLAPEPEVAKNLTIMGELATQTLSLLKTDEDVSKLEESQQLLLLMAQIRERALYLDRFKKITALVNALSIDDPKSLKKNLDLIASSAPSFLRLCAQFNLVNFEANDHYCVLQSTSDFIHAYCRSTKKIIYSYYIKDIQSITLIGHHLYCGVKGKKDLLIHDLTSFELLISKNLTLLKKLPNQDTLILKGDTLALNQPEIKKSSLLFTAEPGARILDFSYSPDQQILAVLVTKGNDSFLTFIRLAKGLEDKYEIKPIGRYPYRGRQAFSLNRVGGSFYVVFQNGIIKVDPNQEPNLIKQKGIWYNTDSTPSRIQLIPDGDRLFIKSIHQHEEGSIVTNVVAYNYFVGFAQVAADLISGYHSMAEVEKRIRELREAGGAGEAAGQSLIILEATSKILDLRFDGFDERHRNGIINFLPLINSEHGSPWPASSSEEKAEAIERYLSDQ